MANETTLALRAVLHDEMTKALKDIQTQITQTGGAASGAAPVVERMGGSFSQAGTGVNDLTVGIQGMISRIPVANGMLGQMTSALSALKSPVTALPALIAGAVVGVMSSTLAMAANVEHMRNLGFQTGLTINQVKGLKTVSMESGVSVDTVAGAIGRFERTLGKNSETMKAYGITARDPVQVLAQAADVFNSISDPMQRAAAMTAIFGRSWMQIAPVLAQGGDAIRKANSSASLSQEQIDGYLKLQAAVHELGAEFAKLKNSITSVFGASVMTDIISNFIALMKDATPIVHGFGVAMAGLAVVFDGALIAFRILAIGFSELDDVIVGGIGAMIGWVGTALEKLTGAVGKIEGLFGDLLPSRVDAGLKRGLAGMGNFSSGMAEYGKTLKENAAADIDATTSKLKALYDVTDNSPEKKKGGKAPPTPPPDNSAILAAEADLQKRIHDIQVEYAEKNASDATEEALMKESERYDKELAEFREAVKKRGKVSTTEQEQINGALRTMEESHVLALEKIQQDAEDKTAKDKKEALDKQKKLQQEYQKEVLSIQQEAAKAETEDLTGSAKYAYERSEITRESELRKQALQDKIKDDAKLQQALQANGRLTAAQLAKIDKQEMDERKKNYEQYSAKVQSLAQSQLESALKGEFTLKSAKEAVKNAAISFIAEESVKRLATFVEDLIFQKSASAAASVESVAQAAATGRLIASSMATAAALQSVATLGVADVTGATGLATTVASAQGLAMAANGTDFAPGGRVLVGERGPELVNIPRGSEIVPNYALNRWTGSQTNTTTTHASQTVNVYSGASAEAVSRIIVRSNRQQVRGLRGTSR